MRRNISFGDAVNFTKFSVYLAWTWPPSRNATKFDIIRYDIFWILSLINVSCLLFCLFAAINVYASNSVIVTQSVCFVCGGFNFLIKTIFYRVCRTQMQILIYEMEDFFKNPQNQGKKVIQRYLNKYSKMHVLVTFVNYMTAVAMICGPALFLQPLPTPAVYPFSVDFGYPKYFAYIHQSIAGMQYSAAIAADCQMALIMWYAGARLEILSEEVKEISTLQEFETFVPKHQRLLNYAVDTADIMSYATLFSATTGVIAMVMSSMQLVGNQPFAVKVQYGPMILICMMDLFLCASSAENLLSACDLMATAVYNNTWTDMSAQLVKNFLFVLRRSQRPVKVSIGGFLPTLSLRFFASYFAMAFSYFTAHRVVIMAESKNS